ncbi:hypothetical protein XENTR_v10008979 [Xenopus tropicalis]|nr:hypothetical protein XENTR_v10008979 [Xenopus tropicalis]
MLPQAQYLTQFNSATSRWGSIEHSDADHTQKKKNLNSHLKMEILPLKFTMGWSPPLEKCHSRQGSPGENKDITETSYLGVVYRDYYTYLNTVFRMAVLKLHCNYFIPAFSDTI